MSWQPNGQSTCENYIAHDNRFYIVWKITWTAHVVNPRYIKQLPFSWWSALFSSTFIWTKPFFKVNLSRCMHVLRSHCRFIFTNSIFIRILRRLAKKKNPRIWANCSGAGVIRALSDGFSLSDVLHDSTAKSTRKGKFFNSIWRREDLNLSHDTSKSRALLSMMVDFSIILRS